MSEFSAAGRSRPLAFAHRGGAALRPENTLEAFDHGLSFGADGLELDVHLSRDGIVVVHHDDTLERTTNARGPIAARDADELARVDAGHWFTTDAVAYPFRGRGFGVPRFRSVLERYPQVLLIVELKTPDAELARKTVDAIREADAIGRVVLGSFYWRALDAARRYEPRIPTGAAREETRWALYRSRVRWPLGRTRYREFQVPVKSGSTVIVTPQFIAHAHRAGLPVRVWTVNEEAEMQQLLEWGADSVISDRPDIAVEVVRRFGAARSGMTAK
ncbi:MAG TPA: glycerophosphodiester phosphodiesterase [Vicinamibacterales bacterium]|nr:glycerophosphodiester phosphodiesterase [Vicinamibacterales bacterium]